MPKMRKNILYMQKRTKAKSEKTTQTQKTQTLQTRTNTFTNLRHMQNIHEYITGYILAIHVHKLRISRQSK